MASTESRRNKILRLLNLGNSGAEEAAQTLQEAGVYTDAYAVRTALTNLVRADTTDLAELTLHARHAFGKPSEGNPQVTRISVRQGEDVTPDTTCRILRALDADS